jgi:hypothetical protein
MSTGTSLVGSSREVETEVRNKLHYRRALDLAELIYTAPIDQRLGIIKTILEAARDHDAVLRNILRYPAFLGNRPMTGNFSIAVQRVHIGRSAKPLMHTAGNSSGCPSQITCGMASRVKTK